MGVDNMVKWRYLAIMVFLIVAILASAGIEGSAAPYSANFDLRNMAGFNDNVISASNIEAFIKEKAPASPMLSESGIGNCFISAGTTNDVNPAFLVATACLEGVFGTAGWAAAHPECHNTFGYGIPSGNTQPNDINCMSSWCGMVQRVASVIATGSNYYTQGLYTVSQVRAKYAANPNTDSIVSLMNELYTFSQNQKISLPTVTTDGGASAVISTAALLGAQITSTGGEKPDLHFCWDTSDHVKGSWPNNHDYGTEDIGPYYYDIFGLTPGTTYYYRCYATNSAGTGWSDYSSFITPVTVTITVKNAAGTAIPNAQIAVTDGGGNTKSATTNSNGQATITGVAGTWQYSVSATGYATNAGSWQVTSSTTSETVTLAQPQATVTITVKNAAGTAIPNAQIAVTDGGGNTKSATTNSNGQATITGITGTWQYSVSATGYATNAGSWQVTSSTTSETVTLAQPQATVTITVKNAAGTAIPNAQIAVTDGGGNTKSATTNSNGQATITGITGTWQYSVSATGYATNAGSWQVTSSTTSETVTLAQPQATVTITVKNAAGTAIPNAQIAVTDGGGNTKSATTNSNGQATITGITGTWQYSVSATGYATNAGSWQVTSSTTSETVTLQPTNPKQQLPLLLRMQLELLFQMPR